MIWDKLKKILGAKNGASEAPPGSNGAQSDVGAGASERVDSPTVEEPEPKIEWVGADSNPWHVPILDVRPFTLTMLSTSSDPKNAENAISHGKDDGAAFIDQQPVLERIFPSNLTYPIDGGLADGVLFQPRQMEHKWAIFYREKRIIFVRSWQRRVFVVAHTEHRDGLLIIKEIHGTFGGAEEDAGFTSLILDFLLRTHALNLPFPAPLPQGMENDPDTAARWCFAAFGNMVQCATHRHIEFQMPAIPLRTHSLLHIAVAQAERDRVDALLKTGICADLLAGDGLAPLHWALAKTDLAIMALLLANGSSVDVRSVEGATPLMNATQSNNIEGLAFLLRHGAEVDARDQRGFTALHRAAEMDHLEMAKALVKAGASPFVEAQGHTPLSLAEMRALTAMIDVLRATP